MNRHQPAATRSSQKPHERGKERTIVRIQPRTRLLPLQHDELVAQHEQLDAFASSERQRPATSRNSDTNAS